MADKSDIVLIKMFLRWYLDILNTQIGSEIGCELTQMMHEMRDEDLLANCKQI